MSIEKESKLDIQSSNFEIAYKNYKLNEELAENQFKFDLFNYKLEIILYTFVVAASLFFILYSTFTYIMSLHSLSAQNILILVESVVIFGYVAFFVSYLIKRKKRKFKLLLNREFERKSNYEENESK